MSWEARRQLLGLVPSNARRELLDELRRSHVADGTIPTPSTFASSAQLEPLEDAMAETFRRSQGTAEANRLLANALRRSIFTIVRRASLAQTLTGVATAGVLRAARYAITKIRKRVFTDNARRQGLM